ncbi:unnamed protein product [Lymnaea stagnalis]|uniref:Uncharacterized protein n=1 Tax=Lymnaea stagnalis TaxID=6523 RepID=A0AAV2HHW8_LYMST
MPEVVSMTECNDTPHNMPYVEENTTETSSPEIDEQVPTETTTTTTYTLSDSNSIDTNNTRLTNNGVDSIRRLNIVDLGRSNSLDTSSSSRTNDSNRYSNGVRSYLSRRNSTTGVSGSVSTTVTTIETSGDTESSNSTQEEHESDESSHRPDTEVTDSTSGESTVTTTITTTPAPSSTSDYDTNNNTYDNSGNPEVEGDNMGDNIQLEEKLRQFQNDSKKDDNEDTKGTYSSTHLSELEKQRRRNLIFDEERFEETFLKCLICREMYNEVDKLPKMLHCHHTYCMDCLYQMYRVEGEFRQSLTGVFRGMPMTVKIQCPTCREGIIISEPELRRLPNDHTIMELLCFVSQTGKNEVQYCTKHQMQPLNFFCEPCVTPVCCDCTVIDHKESKGHVVVNVDEAMKKYTPIVEETLGEINIEKVSLAEKREALESAQDDLDQIQKDLTTQIRAVFDNIRAVLDERERELYDIADSEIERKRELLDGHMRVLVDRESLLNAEFNELQRAKDDKDISLIFTGHKSAMDALAKKVHVPLNSTRGFSVTFQFSSRVDSSVRQQISNLGDIIFQS